MLTPPNLTELYGKSITFGGIRFAISETGQVLGKGGMDIGHIEECFEEGNILRELIGIVKNIELPDN